MNLRDYDHLYVFICLYIHLIIYKLKILLQIIVLDTVFPTNLGVYFKNQNIMIVDDVVYLKTQ